MQISTQTVFNEVSTLLHFNKKTTRTDMDVVSRIRSGLPFSLVENICKKMGLTQKQLSESLGLNTRTLARRKKEQKLHADESDRLYRIVRIYAFSCQVLENKSLALQWLTTPKTALGGAIPLSLLDTEVGAREVERLLGRIEYGVYV